MYKIKYQKEYTRENCLIALQIWENMQCRLMKDVLGDVVPLSIFHVKKGVAEVIYHNKIQDFWRDIILRKVKEEKDFVFRYMNYYGSMLDDLEYIWGTKKTLNNREELKDFFDLASRAWIALSVSYLLPETEGVSKEEQDLGMKLRQRSADFLENIDHVIKDTLNVFYPNLGYDNNFLTIEEVCKDDLPSEEELLKRKEKYIYYNFDIYTEKNLNDLLEDINIEYIQEKAPEEITEIKGQIAMKGKVSGKVRVLNNKSQIPELQEGEVLVTAMTTPDYLPAMNKASAFITDEGGITCHAAIVARELGKPCIIGTKFATQVLKDGMEVEVDADNGIVRILS